MAFTKLTSTLGLLSISASLLWAHGSVKFDPKDNPERAIEFPDTAEYLTLTLDPHTHSVFSDGHVWPNIRVEEALRDGLDALAITEHLEYQPHQADIPHPDRNRSWQQASSSAKESGLLVIHGSEITRSQPVGHLNALFLSDSNALVHQPTDISPHSKEYTQAVKNWPAENALKAAGEQEAFVFLNHLDWTSQQPSGIAELTDFHLEMIDQGLIQGIEVANTHNYSEQSFAIALKHGLTVMGSSDIHGLIDWDYPPAQGAHRPVTLVLAAGRTKASMHEALNAGRTAAWFNNLLIGREDNVRPIVDACISIEHVYYLPKTQILAVSIHNQSDAKFQLLNESDYTFARRGDLIELEPHQSTLIKIRTGVTLDRFELPVSVLNVLVAPKTPLRLKLSGDVEEKTDSL
tara:strand:- start:14214 stop:15428 length:1215 start_codon:yes stop_codon:yes gene_type:complete